MPNSEYFRRQADICFRLSLVASGQEVSSQLMAMAHDYKTNADAIEADSKPPQATIFVQGAIAKRTGLNELEALSASSCRTVKAQRQ
jgi:hypothetical protein